MECRPLCKTVNFVIIENLGKEKGFKQRMESLEESKKSVKEDAEEKSTEKEETVTEEDQ